MWLFTHWATWEMGSSFKQDVPKMSSPDLWVHQGCTNAPLSMVSNSSQVQGQEQRDISSRPAENVSILSNFLAYRCLRQWENLLDSDTPCCSHYGLPYTYFVIRAFSLCSQHTSHKQNSRFFHNLNMLQVEQSLNVYWEQNVLNGRGLAHRLPQESKTTCQSFRRLSQNSQVAQYLHNKSYCADQDVDDFFFPQCAQRCTRTLYTKKKSECVPRTILNRPYDSSWQKQNTTSPELPIPSHSHPSLCSKLSPPPPPQWKTRIN